MLYITNWTDTSRETVNVKYIEFRRKKNEEKIYGTCTCSSYDSIYDIRCFAADEIKSADDLEGKKIGVQLGTTGDADATEVKDATVERYNKGNDAVMALKQGKIDCVVIDSEPAKKFVEKTMILRSLRIFLIKRSMQSVFPKIMQTLPKSSTKR